MTYDLYIGDRLFSSWSLRGWLMLQKFGLAHEVHLLGLYKGTLAEDLKALAPARFVPVLKAPSGVVVGETLAMAETLAEAHPEAGLWPKDAASRALARWLCAEMATGFSALRGECPMQLLHVWQGFAPSPGVLADLARLEDLWSAAWATSGHEGGWLFGEYSCADVFFAPVAARIIGYDLPVSEQARAYCMRVIADEDFQQWRRDGLRVTYDPFPYPQPLTEAPWPKIASD
ncbi:MAG: glutathione S-transferase [Roseobacter sp.]